MRDLKHLRKELDTIGVNINYVLGEILHGELLVKAHRQDVSVVAVRIFQKTLGYLEPRLVRGIQAPKWTTRYIETIREGIQAEEIDENTYVSLVLSILKSPLYLEFTAILAKRIHVIEEVALYKKAHHLLVHNKERECEIIHAHKGDFEDLRIVSALYKGILFPLAYVFEDAILDGSILPS